MTNEEEIGKTILTIRNDPDGLEVVVAYGMKDENPREHFLGSIKARIGCSDGTLVEYDYENSMRLRVLNEGRKLEKVSIREKGGANIITFTDDSLDWVIVEEGPY